MDADMKETAFRMIPYGLYILTAKTGDGRRRGINSKLGHSNLSPRYH